METVNTQVVAAVKLPILNPNEFDLWKMRIEQYFLMTDYSLSEIILNGDAPPPTQIVDGIQQPMPLTSAEQKEDANLKFLRSLPSEWKTYTLIWRNRTDLDTLGLDDLFNNLKIYKAKIKGSSSTSQSP
ncbi:hypothetical protein Tco_1342599 [Tanacetum coccineum]